MLTLVLEDGSGLTNSNSYASVAEGDAYHAGHIYSREWDVRSEAEKTKALVMASRLTDSIAQFYGNRFKHDQAMSFPRFGIYEDGLLLDPNVIPRSLKNGVIELARHLLVVDRTAERENIGISRVRVDSIDISFDSMDTKGILPPSAVQLMWQLGDFSNNGGFGSVKLERA